MSEPTIFTSLAPNISRLAVGSDVSRSYQRSCIASWRALGKDIVSLNAQEEIDVLAALYPDVTFVRVEAQRPRIVDFLEASKLSGKSVSAIVNGDSFLIPNGQALRAAKLAAQRGIVLFERLNVSPETLCPTGEICLGFDLFLFAVSRLDRLQLEGEFAIGSPSWDYWFAISFREAGGEVYSLEGPALMHLDHPASYSQKCWLQNGRRVHGLFSTRVSFSSDALLGVKEGSRQERKFLHSFSSACFSSLKSRSNKIEIDDVISILTLKFIRNLESAGNMRTYNMARDAQARPLQNLKRYLKWQSSKLLARVSPALFGGFSSRMTRRAKKSAPLPAIEISQRPWRVQAKGQENSSA